MKTLGMAILGLLTLVGCESEPAKPVEKAQPKGPEIVAGRTGFQKMYISARGWARDAQPFRLESQYNADSKGRDGKSAIWRAGFSAPSRNGGKRNNLSGTNG